MTDLRYPLAWPPGWPRTARPYRSKFKHRGLDAARKELIEEVSRAGGLNLTISTNIELRLDGAPRAGAVNRVKDHGVAIYFVMEGDEVAFACDTFLTVAENMRALMHYISHLRALPRHGVGTMRQAFAGYKALPAVAGESGRPWYLVLGVQETDSLETCMDAWRAKVRKYHPDNLATGDARKFHEVTTAWKECQKLKRRPSIGKGGA